MKTPMKRLTRRILGCVLSATTLAASIPMPSYAHWDAKEESKPTRVMTRENGAVPVEESWEEVYPYGAFLFENSDASISEGGEEATIPLYRLGGTAGRATAYVAYAPVVSTLNDGRLTYGLAAGREDVEIRAEDELPIAQYQPVGRDPDPEPSGVGIRSEAYTGEDAAEGDRVLTIDAEGASSWQWHVLYEERWQAVEGADKPEFVVGTDAPEGLDYRCVFTKGEKTYSTDSYLGKAYVKPEPEALPELPDDVDLRPDQSFTAIPWEGEDPYGVAVFPLTFAEGEWKKEIRIRATDNEEAQPLRFGTFTIVDHAGGAIFQDASTVTLQLSDDDEGGAYAIGFEAAEVSADKADGAAILRLKRTGGGQDAVTLAWSTADGTARAGVDYESTNGTAVFYADVDEATIEIPLIDDGIKSEEALSFRVELGELKGDARGRCTVTEDHAEISLTNSGTGGAQARAEESPTDTGVPGLFSLVEGGGASSGEETEERPVTGTQVLIPEEELLRGEIAGFDGGAWESVATPEGRDLTPLSTYNYGEISFKGQTGGSYWEDRAYIAGRSDNDIPADWSNGSASGNGWKLTSDGDARAELKIPYMSEMYRHFRGNFSFDFGWCSAWYISLGHAYGWAELMPGVVTTPGAPKVWWDSTTRRSTYGSTRTIDRSWDIDSDVTGVALGTTYHDHRSLDDVYSKIEEGYLTRRTLDNNLRLRIHTANDGESGNGNVATAPKGAAALKEGSGVYRSMKPTVTIDPFQGGVNSSGKLYVGSTAKVSLDTTGTYKLYTGAALDAAVYVTRKDGSRVDEARVEVDGNGAGHVTMVWDGMTAEDLRDEYTVNVVMSRMQDLELNLRPSVERKYDRDGNLSEQIDPDKIPDAWDAFWKGGGDYISLWVSEETKEAPHFDRNKLKEVRVYQSDWESGDRNPAKVLGTYKNIQFINFNRDKGDRIVYNKKSYKGNEKISLAVEDLNFPTLSFLYYREEFLDKPGVMEASINRVELYLDGDGDGRIAGRYDEDTGFFVLDEGTADSFIKIMGKGSYDEDTFQPVELGEGKYGEYFAKVYYTMTPRYLVIPKGVSAEGRAQVLPAFITSRTNEEKKLQLSEEQRKYRYVLAGVDKDGRRTSDDHIMYGEEATGMNYVDVPLGGDRSPLMEVEKGVYRWEPDYEGNLIYPFSAPEPVMIDHSLMGDGHPLVDFAASDGEISLAGDAKDCINGYLGSFTADTDIALCVGEQGNKADELRPLGAADGAPEGLKIEHISLAERTAAPRGGYQSEGYEGDAGDANVGTEGADLPYDELNLDYGMNLAILKSSVMGLATIVMGTNTISILISVPLYSAKKTSGGENAGEWQETRIPQTITKPVSTIDDQIGAMKEGLKSNNYTKYTEMLERGGFQKTGKAGNLTSKSKTFTLSFSAIITLKYDTRDNAWYVQDFTFGIGGSFNFTYTLRLAVCPLVYFFFSVTPSLSITTGGTILRTAVEGDKALISAGNEKVLKKGQKLEGLRTSFVNMNIEFKGKIYIEVLDSKNAKEAVKDTNRGYMSSGGGERVQVQFVKRSSSMSFGSRKYLRIVALEDTTISYLNTIESIKSELRFSGLKIAPKMIVEAGGGFGVDVLKAEVFAKVIFSANFTFSKPTEGGSETVAVDSVGVSISLAFRAVLLGFATYELDIVGWRGEYSGKTGKWTNYWTRGDKEEKINSKGSSGEEGSVSGLSLPRDVSATQTIYSSQPGSEDPSRSDGASGLDPLEAYDADDPRVPFQLSGYNSSGQALRLADGLDLGYDYRVVEADGANYVIFTMGRPGGKGMDTTMLALSRLVTTAEGSVWSQGAEKTGIGDGLGLVNPLDWEEVTDAEGRTRRAVKAPDERSATPYILVDLEKDDSGNLVDDGTGDLGFDVKVFGNEIRVAWVSHAEPTPEPDADIRKAIQASAKNAVVKQATYDVTKKEGFTEAQALSDPGWEAAVYQPTIINEGFTAFVRATHVDEKKRSELLGQYADKLARLGYTAEGDEARKSVYEHRMTTYENALDTKGVASTIYLYGLEEKKLFPAVATHRSGTTDTKVPLEPIDRLKGLELKQGTLDFVYLVYSTWNEDINASSAEEDYDAGLYLAQVMHMRGQVRAYREEDLCASFSTKLGAHSTFDALEIYDKGVHYEAIEGDDSALLVVGQGGKLFTLHFYAEGSSLRYGTLDETDFYGGSADEHRTSFAFGEDGAGNLATVYIHKVEGTGNTGLYLSRYDDRNGTWGKGVLLAMRHMDVHEEAVRSGWSEEETDRAFLGRLEGYEGGSMDQFQFDNPQIALGTKEGASSAGTGQGSGEEASVSDATARNNTTLVVMTQGMMRYLEYRTTEAGDFLVPGADPPADAKYPEGMGIYAITYGVGNQSIGDGHISFDREVFAAGTELTATLSFVNTGDVSIRASEKNPVTVTLSAGGESVPSVKLASWTVTENIVPGREVALYGGFTMPMTLPGGTGFTISLSEDPSYAEDPYSAALRDVYTVEGKRDLGFEEARMELSKRDNGKLALDGEGNVIVDVDLFVGNRGDLDAEDVRLQFSYGVHDPELAGQVMDLKGQESDWNEVIYVPLDIRVNTLEVGEEEELAPLGAAGDDPGQGILALGGIRAGFGRHVRGTITVAADKFAAFGLDGEVSPAGSLRLRAEVYGGGDAADTDVFGLRHASLDEYNTANNHQEATMEHTTAFIAPAQVMLPAGTLLRLPLSFSTTLGDAEPRIGAEELTDREEVADMMDIVAYERGSYQDGIGNGTVIIRGAKEGNGCLRIQDERTNAYQDITIQFTEAGKGIYITNGTGFLTFADEAGKTVKKSGTSWQFGMNEAGTRTQTKGKPGTSFKLLTEAETIELFFDGEVFVSSDDPSFKQGTIIGKGEYEGSRFSFGQNPDNKPHTVTVTVKKPGYNGMYAIFHTLSEYYHGDSLDPGSEVAGAAPTLLWDTHLPERGSLKSNQVFDARLIAHSDSKIADITMDGACCEIVGSDQVTGGSVARTIRFHKNGDLRVAVMDEDYQRTDLSLHVDWWEEEETRALESGSAALAFYEKKYSELSLHALGAIEEAQEVIDHRWMRAAWDEDAGGMRITILENAPLEVMEGYAVTLKRILAEDGPGEEDIPTLIRRGTTGFIPIREKGLYVVAAGADMPGEDPGQDYEIVSADGARQICNTEDRYYANYEYIMVGEDEDQPEAISRTPVVQGLPDNRLTLASVSDGDAIYLLKGGKYTYEDGLSVTPSARNAVTLGAKNGKLSVKKDSLLTLEKGGEEKQVLLHAVAVKKKTVTLSSRKREFALAELFTGVGDLLPDVVGGKYAVNIKKDKNGILDWRDMPTAGGEHITLADLTVGSTGKKGSATITAVFGGVSYTATVKCGGYPVLEAAAGEVVQSLETADAAGNRVLTFDSVSDGDTLLLVKNGKYALEAGVEIEPLGADYKNAVKVTENKRTGIRKLTVKKEAPVKLIKKVETGGAEQTQEKIILVNLLAVKKKTVTLKAAQTCTLADLFPELYELLPDRSGGKAFGGYEIAVTDKKGVLLVNGDAFPAAKPEGQLRLSDFTIARSLSKGSATVAVSFGGKVFKATVKCK